MQIKAKYTISDGVASVKALVPESHYKKLVSCPLIFYILLGIRQKNQRTLILLDLRTSKRPLWTGKSFSSLRIQLRLSMIAWTPRSELLKISQSSSLTQRGLKSIKLLRSLNNHLSQLKLQRLLHLLLMLLRSRVKSQLSLCLLLQLLQRQDSRMTFPVATSCQLKHLTHLLAIGWSRLELQPRTWDKLRREDSFLRSSSWTPTELALKVLSSTNMLKLLIHSLRRTRSTASAVAWSRWPTRSGLIWTTTSASSSTN